MLPDSSNSPIRAARDLLTDLRRFQSLVRRLEVVQRALPNDNGRDASGMIRLTWDEPPAPTADEALAIRQHQELTDQIHRAGRSLIPRTPEEARLVAELLGGDEPLLKSCVRYLPNEWITPLYDHPDPAVSRVGRQAIRLIV